MRRRDARTSDNNARPMPIAARISATAAFARKAADVCNRAKIARSAGAFVAAACAKTRATASRRVGLHWADVESLVKCARRMPIVAVIFARTAAMGSSNARRSGHAKPSVKRAMVPANAVRMPALSSCRVHRSVNRLEGAVRLASSAPRAPNAARAIAWPMAAA